MERFSKENIDALVLLPSKSSISELIHRFAGLIIDFSGILGAIFITAVILIFQLPAWTFILVTLLCLFQIVLFYFTLHKFYQIKVHKYSIDLGIGKDVQLVYASDFHLGKEYSSTNGKRLDKIIDTINSLHPKLLLLGGDYLTHKVEPDLLAELKKLKADEIYAVFGNHDAHYLKPNVQYQNPKEFIEAFATTGIKLLINEHANTTINGVHLTIAGIPDLYSKTFDVNKAFDKAPNNSVRVLLSHNPDVIDFIEPTDNIDLILSGHNHSGQIYLPVIGPVLPMPTKRRWLTKGIFQINKRTKLFLSQGIGFSGTRLRVNTDSEICLITLK